MTDFYNDMESSFIYSVDGVINTYINKFITNRFGIKLQMK